MPPGAGPAVRPGMGQTPAVQAAGTANYEAAGFTVQVYVPTSRVRASYGEPEPHERLRPIRPKRKVSGETALLSRGAARAGDHGLFAGQFIRRGRVGLR